MKNTLIRNQKKFIAVAAIAISGLFTRHYTRVVEENITLVNVTPFSIDYACHYKFSETEWRTEGWKEVQPGESLQANLKVKGRIDPQFFVVGRTNCPNTLKYCFPKEIANADESRIWWEGTDRTARVADQAYFLIGETVKNATPRLTNPYDVGFSRMQLRENGFTHVFALPENIPNSIMQKNLAFKKDDQEGFVHACSYAKALGKSLDRRVQHLSGPGIEDLQPFHLGIAVNDPNGPYEIGVQVTEALSTLRTGESNPVLVGDIITEINFESVFDYIDIEAALYRHGNSVWAGVEDPVLVRVYRPTTKKRLLVQTTYWFCKEYFEKVKAMPTAHGTAIYSAIDAILLGYGENTLPYVAKGLAGIANGMNWIARKFDDSIPYKHASTPSIEQMTWNLEQSEAIRLQFQSQAHTIGAFASMFITPTRLAAQALGRGTVVSRMASSTAGTVMLEVAENAAWAFADRSPLVTDEYVLKELRANLPYIVGLSIVPGVLRKF